jgi:hypothetical protein
MKDRLGRKVSERANDPLSVENVDFLEAVAGRNSDGCDPTRIAGTSSQHLMAGFASLPIQLSRSRL